MANAMEENQETESIYLEIDNAGNADGCLENTIPSVKGNPPGMLMQNSKKENGVASDMEPNAKGPKEEQFDEFLVEAIDEALSSLGEPVKNTVYQHLEDDFNIPKNEIPQKIEDFSDIIHKIFGLGASRLEIKFMKNLSSKLKANMQWSDYEWPITKWIVMEISFTDYVKKMRINYERQVSNKTH